MNDELVCVSFSKGKQGAYPPKLLWTLPGIRTTCVFACLSAQLEFIRSPPVQCGDRLGTPAVPEITARGRCGSTTAPGGAAGPAAIGGCCSASLCDCGLLDCCSARLCELFALCWLLTLTCVCHRLSAFYVWFSWFFYCAVWWEVYL